MLPSDIIRYLTNFTLVDDIKNISNVSRRFRHVITEPKFARDTFILLFKDIFWPWSCLDDINFVEVLLELTEKDIQFIKSNNVKNIYGVEKQQCSGLAIYIIVMLNYSYDSLRVAARYGLYNLVPKLIKDSIDLDSATYTAVHHKHRKLLHVLINMGADIDKLFSTTYYYNNISGVKFILENYSGNKLSTALNEAIIHNYIDIVKIIIARDIDLGKSLEIAAEYGRGDIIRMLIQRDPSLTSSNHIVMAFRKSIGLKHRKIARFLLKHGAEIITKTVDPRLVARAI